MADVTSAAILIGEAPPWLGERGDVARSCALGMALEAHVLIKRWQHVHPWPICSTHTHTHKHRRPHPREAQPVGGGDLNAAPAAHHHLVSVSPPLCRGVNS